MQFNLTTNIETIKIQKFESPSKRFNSSSSKETFSLSFFLCFTFNSDRRFGPFNHLVHSSILQSSVCVLGVFIALCGFLFLSVCWSRSVSVFSVLFSVLLRILDSRHPARISGLRRPLKFLKSFLIHSPPPPSPPPLSRFSVLPRFFLLPIVVVHRYLWIVFFTGSSS
ncbi:hypothetical protein GYMLUDRAFT_390463 [Collybiopsis luxurians FD-317 M1]|uniref:Unplaced genomic scaffold GYMLUscaffold_110, whole genome shotgun sequence n=1 Tax=Collybiopsis luxurians FD-317 M1 TaxID=944289 RepID=A0A0D0BBA6_9AGAR|nr:hypothetical protein GYMLUDRAFT_390463 [Collybiopsis luxurians FD-317 M1]